jgi:hypothetical protein
MVFNGTNSLVVTDMTTTDSIRSFCLLVTLAFGCATACAEVHTWTDANGTVHFSDVPPDEPQQEVEKILDIKPTGTAASTPVQPAVVAAPPAEQPSTPSEPAPQPEMPTPAVADTSIDMLRCDKIRQDLMMFDQNPRIREIDPETGERTVLTVEEREAALQNLLAIRDKVCP